ncbi:MAG: ATP synthase F1 subunit gamma [Candidatus Magasanikbacteria bacterium]|nr:ATP synthase F1 subunit gamma [Candidatus Magasanikbacteria bacterium]
MAVNTKIIKRRLRSIGNIGKITKAMELVSAAKMRKAIEATLNTRVYATLAWELLVNLSKSVKGSIPLLQERPVKKVLVVLITSNRGLCGSFNSNIIKKTTKLLSDDKMLGNGTVEVIGIGKKGADFAKKNNYNLIASFSELSNVPKLSDISPISKMIIESFIAEKYDKVILAYTDFKSSLSQVAVLRQLLPISQKDLEETINALGADDGADKTEAFGKNKNDLTDYIFEPNREEVLKILLPRLVDVQIYQAVLESSASEHSSRMMAMKSANEAADDMIKELNLSFNKARQASITQEIAEIAGGAVVLE